VKGPTGPASSSTDVSITVATGVTIATVDCGAGNHATGGGVVQLGTFAIGDHMVSSYPTDASANPVANGTVNPRYWTMRMESHTGGWTVYATCSPN
jgi:hypothetical protein